MVEWEYKKESHLFSPSVDYLNQLGAEGWELVTAVHPGHPWSSVYTFKRQKPAVLVSGVLHCNEQK